MYTLTAAYKLVLFSDIYFGDISQPVMKSTGSFSIYLENMMTDDPTSTSNSSTSPGQLAPSNPDKSIIAETKESAKNIEISQKTSKKNYWGEVLTFFSKLAAAGGVIGLLISIYVWLEERPSIRIEIENIDLIQSISEVGQNTLQEEIIDSLINLENHFSDITEDVVIDLINEASALLSNSNSMAVKYPDDGSETPIPLEVFKENLQKGIDDFEKKREESSNPNQKERFLQLINKLKYAQKFVDRINSDSQILLTVRVENRSRLDNYIDSKGVLMFHKDERESASVPQMIVSLMDSSQGKVDGYGVSSLNFEATVNDLESDNEKYVDAAFKSRANNIDDYNIILVLQDIKDKPWHEQVMLSAFTERKIKQELKANAGNVFERIQK